MARSGVLVDAAAAGDRLVERATTGVVLRWSDDRSLARQVRIHRIPTKTSL
jgi:hypothetical protein